MSERKNETSDERVDDLEVPAQQSGDVKGGVAAGDVNTDGPAFIGGDPDQPVIAAKLRGLHKTTDVTLKRG
jgi:hypothetical protein